MTLKDLPTSATHPRWLAESKSAPCKGSHLERLCRVPLTRKTILADPLMAMRTRQTQRAREQLPDLPAPQRLSLLSLATYSSWSALPASTHLCEFQYEHLEMVVCLFTSLKQSVVGPPSRTHNNYSLYSLYSHTKLITSCTCRQILYLSSGPQHHPIAFRVAHW